jgi:hypothetical protein
MWEAVNYSKSMKFKNSLTDDQRPSNAPKIDKVSAAY